MTGKQLFTGFLLTACLLFSNSSLLALAAAPSHLVAARQAIKEKRYGDAVKILKKGAAGGCKYSACLLGKMHKDGIGVKPDINAAVKWFEKSISDDENALAEAQLELGKIYLQGCREIRPQGLKARKYLRQAADNGLTEAGDLLRKIPGEDKVETAASDLHRRASAGAQTTETGVEEAWKGYADIVNLLNAASETRK